MKIAFYIVLQSIVNISFVCNGLKIYKSTIPEHVADEQTMLRLIPNGSYQVPKSLTLCMRFNFKRFRGALLYVEKGVFRMLIKPKIEGTWIGFGNRIKNTTQYFSSVVRDQETGSFELWRISYWHSICLSYDNDRRTISFIKVIWRLHCACILRKTI